jgi:Mce-associated membrane protein
MNPTLYDILGVAPDASREEIRKAWRDAADRFEPGEGGSTKQFRLFNEAAEVLLDPERRKAYDAQLGSDERGNDDGVSLAKSEAAPARGASPDKPRPTADAGKAPGAPTLDAPIPGSAGVATAPTSTVVADAPEAETGDDRAAGETGGRTGRPLPWWVLAVLGVVTAVLVGTAAFMVFRADRAEAYQESLNRAPAAAESAAAAVLSYKYSSLEADRDAAAKFLTDGYRKDYVDTFDKLVKENATKSKATVEAQVLASSAMVGGGDRDPDRVPVLLFVNQTTTSTANSGQPSVALNRVRFDMVKVDGTWLVDGITSY